MRAAPFGKLNEKNGRPVSLCLGIWFSFDFCTILGLKIQGKEYCKGFTVALKMFDTKQMYYHVL